jgi:SAM-dependent methyltransferase
MQESKNDPFVDQDRSAAAAANAGFWNDLCGSAAARAWGITDRSMDSLRRYDENFLRYYPYLSRHIPWTGLHGKRVLEIGLGYGTVSQKLAETGAIFTGLDIAANPVALVRHRLRQNGLPGKHYLAIAEDFSDLDDVLRRFSDLSVRRTIIEDAYAHVSASHTYAHRMRQVAGILRGAARDAA